MYYIFFVLDDPKRLNKILDSWSAAGVNEATIMESTGVNRFRSKQEPNSKIGDLLQMLVGSQEEGNYTLSAIVSNMEIVQACIDAVEDVVGSLDDPNTGVLAVWPVPVVKGRLTE